MRAAIPARTKDLLMRRPVPLKLSTPLLPLLFVSLIGGCASEPADGDTEASTGTAGSTGTATETGAASFPTSTETPTTDVPTTAADTGTSDTGDTGDIEDPTGEPLPPVDLDPWRDAIMYFVFVDRFANGDPGNDAPIGGKVDPQADYLGGDWKGLLGKIEVAQQSDERGEDAPGFGAIQPFDLRPDVGRSVGHARFASGGK